MALVSAQAKVPVVRGIMQYRCTGNMGDLCQEDILRDTFNSFLWYWGPGVSGCILAVLAVYGRTRLFTGDCVAFTCSVCDRKRRRLYQRTSPVTVRP